ncbi:MAG TPA: hypothetical protein VFS32_04555 [Candidatus Limnocylindrales bacterium]|nr:hypothetical protein [Candidatus Limnocylindrales bacterium]
MDLLLALAGLTLLAGAAGRVVGAIGGSSDLLAGLFRSSHELGWPIGVQEEDTPPHIPIEAESPPEPSLDAAAWRTTVRAEVRIGQARR